MDGETQPLPLPPGKDKCRGPLGDVEGWLKTEHFETEGDVEEACSRGA